jgi:hypothetical protein
VAVGGQRDAAMSRLHAFLVSLQELRSLQAAEADWPTAHGAKPAGSAREPSTGDPICGTSAWVDPSMPPDTEHFAALDCVRDLRERQQQQAADALLRDAKLRLLQDRLQAQQLQMDGIDQPRHTARCLGNEYMRQAGRQRTGSARGAKPGSSTADTAERCDGGIRLVAGTRPADRAWHAPRAVAASRAGWDTGGHRAMCGRVRPKRE